MKYYLFHDHDNEEPQFCKAFKSLLALRKYIKEDITMLKQAYPREKWTDRDYLIAKRMK